MPRVHFLQADGSIDFGTYEFSEEDFSNTDYYFTIKESIGDDEHVAYDTREYHFAIASDYTEDDAELYIQWKLWWTDADGNEHYVPGSTNPSSDIYIGNTTD